MTRVIVHMHKRALHVGQVLDFALQRLANVVRLLERDILVQNDMRLDQVLETKVVRVHRVHGQHLRPVVTAHLDDAVDHVGRGGLARQDGHVVETGFDPGAWFLIGGRSK